MGGFYLKKSSVFRLKHTEGVPKMKDEKEKLNMPFAMTT